MTEPEDHDEDLFADLYDADEPASKPVLSAQPESIPEPMESPTPLQNDVGLDDTKQDMGNEVQTEMTDFNSKIIADGLNGNYNGLVNGQMADSRGTRMDVAVEQDPGGIGIKEDG
ncbi:MAG: hypothetical protein Q9167_000723 [Letrouitia subvulpina]